MTFTRVALTFICIISFVYAVQAETLLIDMPISAEATNSNGTMNSFTEINESIPLVCSQEDFSWITVDDGLFYYENNFGLPVGNSFILVRIDPQKYKFSLHMASEDGAAFSLKEWAAKHNLIAAVNAGMFLPDKKTSIGYMQSATHSNNEKIGGRLGAFFVAETTSPLLQQADILDRGDNSFKEKLSLYSIRIQNFRMVDEMGKVLWNSDTRRYSIAAVGKDKENHILFIVCQFPVTGAEFTKMLQLCPIELSALMYVEGGEKAGLYLREATSEHIWVGRTAFFNTNGDAGVALPNILGISKR